MMKDLLELEEKKNPINLKKTRGLERQQTLTAHEKTHISDNF